MNQQPAFRGGYKNTPENKSPSDLLLTLRCLLQVESSFGASTSKAVPVCRTIRLTRWTGGVRFLLQAEKRPRPRRRRWWRGLWDGVGGVRPVSFLPGWSPSELPQGRAWRLRRSRRSPPTGQERSAHHKSTSFTEEERSRRWGAESPTASHSQSISGFSGEGLWQYIPEQPAGAQGYAARSSPGQEWGGLRHAFQEQLKEEQRGVQPPLQPVT